MSRNDFSLLVVSFATALVFFFAPSREPPVNMGLLLIFGTLLAVMMGHLGSSLLVQKITRLGLVFALAYGWAQFFTLAHYRGIGTPPILYGEQSIAGEIAWSEPRLRGAVVDMRLQDSQGRAFGLRLYGKRDMAKTLRPGCHAELTARLAPLSLPSVIGGYDPRFVAWFDGRIGRGFIGTVEAVNCPTKPSWQHRLSRLRLSLAAHYRALMSAETGPVAAALVTGVRGAIPGAVREAFRQSGLAHMLAISGLHMALFAGSLYALLRYGAALWPGLVLRYDVRKPAAVVALMAATGYLLLSGASFATERAYIMLAIFFLAILLDRPAITMRNVLWAALLVLIVQPHAIMQVGFQMSFAAVMALVSAYEVWQRHDRFYILAADMTPLRRFFRYIRRYSMALFFTSLIAGAVTGLVAILHFYRIGTFGLPGNLLAMPIFGTLIMPMAPVSLLLSPLGMEAPFIAIMQFGIWLIIEWAQWLTAFDGAVRHFGASPTFVLPLMAIGFIWLVLSAGKWRLLGLVLLLPGLLLIGRGERPLMHFVGRDLIIAQDHAGQLHVLRNRGRDYELKRIFDFHGQIYKAETSDMACTEGCGLLGQDRRIIAYLTAPRRLSVACRNSDVVVLPFATAKYPCQALLIDESKLQRDTPLQIRVEGRALVIKKAANGRLWMR